MSEFIEIYPEIECHLLLLDREVDLSMREADLAVRFSPPRQADLVQRHLMTVSLHIYASAGYIKKHGVPQTTKDLDKHRIVVYGEEVRPPVPDVNWLLRIGYKARKRTRLNSSL